MPKVIITEFLSLDGVAEAPEKWSFAYSNDESVKFKNDELERTGALLLGRNTYEIFAAAWPSRKGPYGDRFNALPKFVLSSAPDIVFWNGSEFFTGPLSELLSDIKAKEFKGDIYVHGSLSLARSLISEKLADELHLLIYPIILGSGRRLLDAVSEDSLKLIDATSFATGALALKYQVAR